METRTNSIDRIINWKKTGYILLKSLIFLVIFAILHYLYTLSPNPFFQAISGKDESVFQHLKMGFFAYLFLIGIDYLLSRKRIDKSSSFIFSRLLATILIPWLIFIIWYLVPAFVGSELPLAYELVWALSVVFIIGIFASIIDNNTEKIMYSLSAKIIISVLIVISTFIFIWFSFKLPWIDVFTLP